MTQFNSLFSLASKKTSKVHITYPVWEEPLVISGFPSQRASNVEIIPMSCHHHIIGALCSHVPSGVIPGIYPYFSWLLHWYHDCSCVSTHPYMIGVQSIGTKPLKNVPTLCMILWGYSTPEYMATMQGNTVTDTLHVYTYIPICTDTS